MHFTDNALELLRHLESFRARAYRDQCKSRVDPRHRCRQACKGKWTIGYGHTGPEVREGLVWTQAQGDAQLEADLAPRIDAVRQMLTGISLTDNQFSALVIFAFNVGVVGFFGSTALRDIKLGQLARVPADMALWNKVTDESGVRNVDPILVDRREAEARLWRTS